MELNGIVDELVLGREVSGFECIEFEALVRELDEDIW